METAEDWMRYLVQKADEGMPRVRRLRGYTDGNAPLPEMGPNLRRSWAKFQRKAVANSGGLVVNALCERVKPSGVIVGDDPDGPATAAARLLWRDNRLDAVLADAIRDCFIYGAGYLLTSVDEGGAAVITRESPEWMYVEPDPIRPWRARAAVKAWRDMPAQTDHLHMWAPGVYASWTRPCYDSQQRIVQTISGGWAPEAEAQFDGPVPVAVLENAGRRGEFEDQTGLIDRINLGILYRLVTMAMQTYRQRALKVDEGGEGLPQVDADGNQIDYQDIFEPGPGALWELPPGVSLWESQTTDVNPFLAAVKDDWRELAAETSTPLSAMLPDAANQSASGAEQPMRGLVSKAEDRIGRIQPAVAACLASALRASGVDPGGTVEVLFEHPAYVSISEKYAAAAQARGAGLSLETVEELVLGMSPVQIAQDRRRRLSEQMEAAAQAAPAAQAPAPVPQAAPAPAVQTPASAPAGSPGEAAADAG